MRRSEYARAVLGTVVALILALLGNEELERVRFCTFKTSVIMPVVRSVHLESPRCSLGYFRRQKYLETKLRPMPRRAVKRIIILHPAPDVCPGHALLHECDSVRWKANSYCINTTVWADEKWAQRISSGYIRVAKIFWKIARHRTGTHMRNHLLCWRVPRVDQLADERDTPAFLHRSSESVEKYKSSLGFSELLTSNRDGLLGVPSC